METRESFWELHRKLAECYQHDVAAGTLVQHPHHVPVHPPLIDRRGSLQRRLSLQSVQKENSLASGTVGWKATCGTLGIECLTGPNPKPQSRDKPSASEQPAGVEETPKSPAGGKPAPLGQC